MELLLKNSEEMKRLDKNERRVAEELALYAAVHHIKDAKQLQILKEMIQAKPVDVFRYQELWNQFFKR